MKKILQGFLSVILALLMFSIQAMAYTSSAASINTEDEISKVVDFDEAEIYMAFDQVENLIITLEENKDLTYVDLAASNSELITNVSSNAAMAMNSTSASDNPPIIGAFLWGCLFNWVGMLVVGFSTSFENEQIMKSGWGCLLSSLFWSGGLIYF